MVSLTSGSIRLFSSLNSSTGSNTCLSIRCVCAVDPRTKFENPLDFGSLRLVAANKSNRTGLGFCEGIKRKKQNCCSWCGGFVRRCKKERDWDSEGNDELEAEILEFMKNSGKPSVFPSKKDFIDAGRKDLVEAVLKQGGWLSMGWDLDSDEDEVWVPENDDFRDWDLNIDKKLDNGALQEGNGAWSSYVSNSTVDSPSWLASSSARSLEAAIEDDSGIEGILSRLERERNLNLGLSFREKGNINGACSNTCQNKSLARSSTNTTVGDLQRHGELLLSPSRSLVEDSEGKFHENKCFSTVDGGKNPLEPETWRTWGLRRAGFSDMEFEDADISSSDMAGRNKYDVPGNDGLEKNGGSSYPLIRRDESNYVHDEVNRTHIKSRLQNLQSELSSVLHSLRSHTNEVVSDEDHEDYPNDFEKLSDAWEFQENEIMVAQDKLRSTRAKLAVLEGKMALAIIDARRIVGEKQKRINHARRALRLLRTACIVWPNSASEVLLAGSFDGWFTQRRMEKSKNGVFSVWLKLYPGKYEIKFIVDGQWKVDPLRPIVNNNGYENNLLIIT